MKLREDVKLTYGHKLIGGKAWTSIMSVFIQTLYPIKAYHTY